MSAARPFPDDVGVAVVAHDARSTLPRVIACLLESGVPGERITVYDIASSDGTGAWLAEVFPSLRTARLETNDGPNPARNRAIEEATTPYLLLVDSDAYLRPDAPAALRAAISEPGVGAAVPVVVHADAPDRIQYADSGLHFICEATTPLSGHPLATRGEATRDIGTAPGVCFLLDVQAARAVGGFDARYFMGKEDGEFCYRLRTAGYRLVETPRAIAEHGSRPRSAWLYPYQVRNRWHFMLKNYEARTLIVLTPALLLHEPLQLLVLAVGGHGRAWLRGVRGLLTWLPGLAADRRMVGRMRRVHDGVLLTAAPLVVRADITGGGLGRAFKRGYDAWLAFYWRITSWLLA